MGGAHSTRAGGVEHGTFDNDVDVVKAALKRVLGAGAAIAPQDAQWNLDY